MAIWIDPISCNLSTMLNDKEMHLIFLMKDSDGKFYHVNAQEFNDAHSANVCPYTTNSLIASFDKDSIIKSENISDTLCVNALPRIRISVDCLFADIDDLHAKIKNLNAYYQVV